MRSNAHHGGDLAKAPLSDVAYKIPRRVFGNFGFLCHTAEIGNIPAIFMFGPMKVLRLRVGFSSLRLWSRRGLSVHRGDIQRPVVVFIFDITTFIEYIHSLGGNCMQPVSLVPIRYPSAVHRRSFD